MTGVLLPQPVGGSASGWRLVDYVTRRASTAPATDGTAVVELDQLADDELWLIDHAVVSCDSTTPTIMRWYESAVTDFALLDGTATGNFDVGDWPAGLHVRPTQSLIAAWFGADDGAVGHVVIQARVLRR